MPKGTATVNYGVCRPAQCAPGDGVCPAVGACTRGILVQEGPYDEPFVFPVDMCQGCGDCAKACVLWGIRIE